MHLSFAPSARHVVAHAVRSKRNGAPLSQIARRQTRLPLPATVVRFAGASRGSDPIQPASQLASLERLLQASAASPSRKAFVSCLIQNRWHDGNKKHAAKQFQTRNECLICRNIAIAPSVCLPLQKYWSS